MFLEAVSVCVQYSDILSHTAPRIRPLFDRWIIVTTPDDEGTREVCRKHNIDCIFTDTFYEGGDEFNKAKGINLGLERLNKRDWVCHIDADIVLPPDTRQFLSAASLRKDTIYGIDRVMLKSWEDWQKFLSSGYLQHDYHARCNFPKGFEVGARWVSPHYGFCPIGFFQLWHGPETLYKGIASRRYPDVHNDAARADVQYSLTWDRPYRALLPELIAIHLESEAAPLGANWKGRTTKPFGPPPKPQPEPTTNPQIFGARNRRGRNDPDNNDTPQPPS